MAVCVRCGRKHDMTCPVGWLTFKYIRYDDQFHDHIMEIVDRAHHHSVGELTIIQPDGGTLVAGLCDQCLLSDKQKENIGERL